METDAWDPTVAGPGCAGVARPKRRHLRPVLVAAFAATAASQIPIRWWLCEGRNYTGPLRLGCFGQQQEDAA